MSEAKEIEKVIERLVNDQTALETAREHFEIDHKNSGAFQPVLKVKPGSILNGTNADQGLVGFFNARSRRRRKRKFEKRLKRNPDSFVIISEGDSWFQYPVFLKDIIDHLYEYDDYAIRSFGFGADWLSNIVEEAEFINDIKYYNARVLLLSGGGNDLLGAGRIKTILKAHNPNQDRTAKDYFNDTTEVRFREIEFLYSGLFRRLNRLFPKLHIICHSYDYAIPKSDRWLGDPMDALKIPKGLQSEIVIILIDRFHSMLENLAGRFNNIHVIDNRNSTAPNEWHDELHPNSYGYLKASEAFAEKIEEIRYKI